MQRSTDSSNTLYPDGVYYTSTRSSTKHYSYTIAAIVYSYSCTRSIYIDLLVQIYFSKSKLQKK